MNKKLISALFVGALLLGSTSALTSCKDYDDDIDNLQTQIDKAALASDVDALKASLTSATATATAAKTSADAAVASAKAANDAVALKAAQADLTAAVARITALETEMSKLTDFEAKLQATVDTEIASLKTEFATLKAEIEEMVGTMVTDVSVFASYVNGYFSENEDNRVVVPMTGTQSDNVFGKTPAADRTIAYTKGASINFPSGLIVRINPANYTPSTSDIKLINSKGEDLSSVLDIVSVEKFDGLLTLDTHSVGNGTGLWRVGIQLKDGKTNDDLQALTITDTRSIGNPVLFAVAVNNTSDDTRSVVSSYDVIIPGAIPYVGENSLSSVLVNKVAISDIHNRYNSTEASTMDMFHGKTIDPWETVWTGDAAVKGTTSNSQLGDNRQGQSLIMATLGQELPISFKNLPDAQYYYVTLDTKNSVDSDNSEINAWNSYTYTGLNTIYNVADGSSISVTKMGKTEDIIGFRIYAVNFDGTLVDPDGSAFYVYVGDQSNVGSATGSFVPTQSTPNTTAAIAVSGTFLTGGDFAQTGSITFKNEATGTFALLKADGKTAATKWSEVGSVKITIISAAADWKDGATSTAQIVGNKNGTPFNIINVSLTKSLPTTFPSAFGWKAGQLVNSVYTCYVDPTTGWTTLGGTPNGTKDLNNVCNGLSDASYVFTIANATVDGDGNYTKSYSVTSPYVLTVDNKLIDSNTAHALTVSYKYFNVSSENDATNGHNVIVKGQDLSIKFACILNTTLQTYAWAPIPAIAATSSTPAFAAINVNQLKYSADPSTKQYIPATFLAGTNAFDATTWSKSLGDLNTYYTIKNDAKLISKETGTVDYFSTTAALVNHSVVIKADGTTGIVPCLEFTPLSSTSTPNVNVASTLKITLIDAFGHENAYSLDVTVNK